MENASYRNKIPAESINYFFIMAIGIEPAQV
jgi:hypothetical protein